MDEYARKEWNGLKLCLFCAYLVKISQKDGKTGWIGKNYTFLIYTGWVNDEWG